MIYAITYDLRRVGQNYDSLYQSIRNLGQTLHPLQNLWLVSTNLSADGIRDSLMTVIDQNDQVFVAQLSAGSYSAFMDVTAHEWLEARL